MWLSLNGLNVGAIAAVGDTPKGGRRDIGDKSPAGDGSLRVTRQTRKRDLTFTTIPLTGAVAHAWESFLIGEGETWAFDLASPFGLYGSKGLGPSSSFGGIGLVASPAPKFGALCLKLTDSGSGASITWTGAAKNVFGLYVASTVMVWRFESLAWHHYVVRSDGAKWLDGVRNNAAPTSWLSATSGDVQLSELSGGAIGYDDLVVLPYLVPDAWPPLFFASGAAFSALPYLSATGLLVNEQPTRRVLGEVESEQVLVASSSGVRQSDMKKLSVELKAA